MPKSPGYCFKVFRYDHTRPDPPRFDTFAIDPPASTSVLEALLALQADVDGSLAFRYSCRGAVCGSCGMIINGTPDLACRVQLASLEDDTIVLEPLAKLDVLKDLVVDMAPFWSAYRRIEPWLISSSPFQGEGRAESGPPAEGRMSQRQVDEVLAFANCVLCASCTSACPVQYRDPDFIGPAAMAALYRHLADARDQRSAGFLSAFNNASGLWGCDTVFRCCKVCPKQVRPTDAFESLRRKWVVFAMRGLFGRGKHRVSNDSDGGHRADPPETGA